MRKIEEAAKLITEAERILVFTGAGISTNSGIPDFRGPQGLYNRVQTQYGLPYPEALFDLSFFKNNPEPFFAFSKELFSDNLIPTPSHYFLADLEKKGKLELLVTQNIDMLHHRAGSRNIEACHGTYQNGHCTKCCHSYPLEAYEHNMIQGTVPYCSCGGVIKPDIVFFGETLPDSFVALMDNPPEADLLLVLGTSLTVYPAAALALSATVRMPSILITLEPTPEDHRFDIVLHQDLDQVIFRLD